MPTYRVQPILPSLVLIQDNAMVSIEFIHYMKMKIRGSNGCIALKLDINKADDHMDWDYLTSLMGKMGFNDQ